tara:strand:- start:446 stop:571 length:126 start_codon:yes stop_codon:yes gene_type:complete
MEQLRIVKERKSKVVLGNTVISGYQKSSNEDEMVMLSGVEA